MAKPPRTAISGTFFVTAVTNNDNRHFHNEEKAKLFLETLQHYRREGLYQLHAFVAMPDHVHLLLTTKDLPTAMRHIKAGFSRKVSSHFAVWQRGYTDHLVKNREEFEVRRNYIHQNPVKGGIVLHAEEYPYSSAYRQTLPETQQ